MISQMTLAKQSKSYRAPMCDCRQANQRPPQCSVHAASQGVIFASAGSEGRGGGEGQGGGAGAGGDNKHDVLKLSALQAKPALQLR